MMDSSKPEVAGYILRIATEEWVDHVFEMAIYYTNLKRKWKSGQAILFIHKTPTADALVGYGVVDHVAEKSALSGEDRLECERGSWKRAIEFKYVKRFEKPLLVKETFLKDSKRHGRFFHGLQLSRGDLERILSQAEKSSIHQKS
jgi:hypothetical protein